MKAKILWNQEVSPGYFKMLLHSEEVSKKGKAGQFLMLRVREEYDPLLPRAFAIHKKIPSDSSLEILYQVVGKGTRLMSCMKPEEEIHLIGPLGNGFDISDKTERAILIAGGMGIAPFYFLAEELKKKGIKTHLLVGGKKNKDILCIEEFRSLGLEIDVTTEDGTLGKRGMATWLFRDLLKEKHKDFFKDACIYACGPYAMLKNIASLTSKHSMTCQVSLEAKMACGMGACLGCVVKARGYKAHLHEPFSYERVCKEGPVFDSGEIFWE